MRHHIIRAAGFFQSAFYATAPKMTSELAETLLLLSTGHLFGLYNPNQVADALSISKNKRYRDLKEMSLYQWKSLLVGVASTIAIEAIRQTESKSASTQSRRCITISVDDTNDPRYAKTLSYGYKWWSTQQKQAIKGRNILAITLKIGDVILPLNIRIVSKQGRGNTDKPTCFRTMIQEVLEVFDAQGIDLRKYPITFDSWYGSKTLIETLLDLGFTRILVHGKSNYVMEIDAKTAKLSAHKKTVKLLTQQWGCDKPVRRFRAKSPTFRQLVLLCFSANAKTQTMLVFGRPLRAAETLHIWAQHHGIEQFWRHLKTDLRLSAMSLHHRNGAYGTLGIKVLSYLMIQQVSRSTRLTFHHIKLQLSGDRQLLSVIAAHFHEPYPQEHI
ncbi:MAG: transposase [Candidatus Poribacteria bacterium]|nr:transposase [Candidatus Poribacteria bacterium]